MAVDLGKQIGPLPLGAWVVVVAGGLGIALYTRKQGSAGTTVVEDTSGTPGVGDGSVGGWVPTQPSTGAGGDVAPTTPTTNEEWGTRAINYLIAQGYDPLVSDSAIRKYLAGNYPQPSASEYALQRIALARFGSPPQPLPPSDSTPGIPTPPIPKPPSTVPGPVKPPAPKPVPKPPAPKPRYRYYTVRAGDNLWNIARHFYGSGLKYWTIYYANRVGSRRLDGKVGPIRNPNHIEPGWVLLIP